MLICFIVQHLLEAGNGDQRMKLCMQAQACAALYPLLQLGVSIFTEQEDGNYNAATFNIALFPGELTGKNRTTCLQTSSLRFLVDQGLSLDAAVSLSIPSTCLQKLTLPCF